jgi:hypothetical protein
MLRRVGTLKVRGKAYVNEERAMGDTKDDPSQIYYHASHGKWRGVMRIRITNTRMLHRAMGWLNALSLIVMAVWPPWLGRFILETTVDFEPTRPVRHTTTVLWLGVPMMKSVEELVLHENGTCFQLRGETRMTLLPWRRLTMEGQGEVDSTATCATYNLIWLGTQMKQTTERSENQVKLQQEAPGFRSSQTLQIVSK